MIFPRRLGVRQLSVWVSDLSARLSSHRSAGIIKELTPWAGGQLFRGIRGGKLPPVGRSLGDRHLFRELTAPTCSHYHPPQRRPRTLELGAWREAWKPKASHELRAGKPHHSPAFSLQTLAPLLTSNSAVTLKWLKFGTSSKAFSWSDQVTVSLGP